MKRLALALALTLSTACGSPPEPPKNPAEPAAPGEDAAPTADAAPAAEAGPSAETPPAAEAPAAAPAGGLSKAALVEANKMVMEAYPAPFEKTFAAVVAKIGEPKKKGENMNQWFSFDGGKCVQFFMTKDSKKGHAASGIADTDAADCK